MLCIAAALGAVLVRKQQPGLGATLSMAAGLVALALSMPALREVVTAFIALSEHAGLLTDNAALMLRACGIALICEFGAGLCSDAGEGQLAQRIEFGGRAALLAMSLPLLSQLMEAISAWLP